MASQHATGADSRALGNVFETSLQEIWNGPAYQQARRLVSDPSRSLREPELKESFCDGCFVIFDTSVRETARWAHEHRWEDVFEADSPAGKPIRRPRKETGLPY